MFAFLLFLIVVLVLVVVLVVGEILGRARLQNVTSRRHGSASE
jgi:hypothetical protein